MPSTLDVEVTNRSNAKCRCWPRDRTPHQGLMPLARSAAASFSCPIPDSDIRKARRYIPVATL